MNINQHIEAAEKASQTLDAFAVVDPGATAMSGLLHSLIALASIERAVLKLAQRRSSHPVFSPTNPCGVEGCEVCYPPGAPKRD